MELSEGAVVRDRKWGGRYCGTVVATNDRSVFVAWHGSFVEDELDRDEVEPVTDPTPAQQAWRGGIGLVAGGAISIEPIRRS